MQKLKRYPLSKLAKTFIAIGIALLIITLALGIYSLSTQIASKTKIALYIVLSVWVVIFAFLLLVIKYRYEIFEKYPYLMSLPSLFYQLKGEKRNKGFSMIFTIHAFTLVYLGFLGLLVIMLITKSPIGFERNIILGSLYTVIILFVVGVLLVYRWIYKSLK